jgi:3-deoxy-D-manno-octulosonic-acid transferase
MSIAPKLFRKLYNVVLTIAVPLLFLRLFWRSRKNPDYRERWLERLGLFNPPEKKDGIWLHAVSAGEAIASVPLIRALIKQFPNLPITVTTTTPTGSARVKQMLGEQVFHVYFPFDLSFAIRNFLSRIKPKICILMETELWPNCILNLNQLKIPVVIANARLSPRSVKGYGRILSVTREMLKSVDMVAAQSKMDGDRFLSLGLPSKNLQITGNIKFDMMEPPQVEEKAQNLRMQWGIKRPVWIAASTHGGEEEEVLKAFLKIREKLPEAFLILVPRHTERKDAIQDLIKQHSLSFINRSSGEVATSSTSILLGDTMGEMPVFYRAADVAFVGGSFVPVGGHNTLEPASAEIPVVVGPHVHNFVDITNYLSAAGGLLQVQNSDGLAQTVLYWLSHEEERKKAGKKAKQVVLDNRGAVNKIVQICTRYFNNTSTSVQSG